MRLKTALAATAAVAAALAIAIVVGIVLQRRELTAAVQLVAEREADNVASQLSGGRLDASTLGRVTRGEESMVQVLDGSGQVVYASSALAGRPPMTSIPGAADPTTRVLRNLANSEDGSYAVAASRTKTSGGTAYVVVAQSLEDVRTATAAAVRLAGVGYPLLLALVAGVSYWLTGRALAPVERMRRRVAEITAEDLSARVPTGAGSVELDRLGGTMNDMLARLQAAAEAQGRFVSDASHELRSPVASIRASHEVALALPQTLDLAQLHSDVLLETRRLERLIADLVKVARGQEQFGTIALGPVDLQAVVTTEVARVRRVPVTVSSRPAWVVGDADGLAVALRNLLDNAERHAATGVWVELVTDSGCAEVVVRDDGAGIPAAERERVFERFVRLDESRSRDAGGFGLGLSITRRIIGRHGGTVTVEDAGRGASIHVRVPLGTHAVGGR